MSRWTRAWPLYETGPTRTVRSPGPTLTAWSISVLVERHRHPHGAVHGGVLGHEAGELFVEDRVVHRARGWAALDRPRLEAGEALVDVAAEARLRELAVAGDVDADLGLHADDVLDALRDDLVELRLVELGARDFLEDHLHDLGRTDQATYVSREDTVGASLHLSLLPGRSRKERLTNGAILVQILVASPQECNKVACSLSEKGANP